jgi:hypothetical protein
VNEILIPSYESGPLNAGRIGDLLTVTASVPNIDAVLAHGYTRLLLERSRNSGITWEEVGTPDGRPVLSPGVTGYAITDGAGNAGYLYRTRFLNTNLPCGATGRVSDPSVSIPGAGILASKVITVKELIDRYLFGVRLTDDKGNVFTDSAFQFYIVAAVRRIERALDISILPQLFVENRDYYATDWKQYGTTDLSNYPLIDVQQFRVTYPSGQTIIVWPNEWLRINKEQGNIRVVPTAGSLSEVLLAEGGVYMLGSRGYIPDLFQIVYTAGFEEGCIPSDILDLIGKAAALGPFNVFGDLIAGAGIATLSLSMDGLSQSIGTTASATNAGFGARLIQYDNDLKKQIPLIREYYRRPGGMVVA